VICVRNAGVVVQVRFVAQPFADGRDLRDFLSAVGADEHLMQLDVVVAWAKRSGLSRLQPHLEMIRDRGGQMRLVVGIDEGGATRQGLELAKTLFDSVHVFHDRSGRTFHPKVYLAAGVASARLLVGSNNATAGGVYFNYEAGVESELTLPDDEPLLMSVRDYVARLYADTDLCKELTEAVLAEMVVNPRYRIGDEDARSRAAPSAGGPEELDADVDVEDGAPPTGAAPSIFGTSAEPKRTDPDAVGAVRKAAVKRPVPAKKAATKKATPPAEATSTSRGPVVGGAAVRRRWFKKLSPTDALQNTGHSISALRLSKAKHDIVWQTYFRYDFFGDQTWTTETSRQGFPMEAAIVDFNVKVDGQDLGVQPIRVDHAPHREKGQLNVPTDLKWGPVLSAALRRKNFTSYFVVLGRLTDGSSTLTIQRQDPGAVSFVK